MSETALSRGLYALSEHCCCCCCRYRLNMGMTHATAIPESVVNSTSGTPRSTGSRNSGDDDRLRRLKANGRERVRVNALNAALARLRSVLPTGNGNTGTGNARRRSKIATLRAAQRYIRALSSVLSERESAISKPGGTDPGTCSTASSQYGVTSRRQQESCFGVVLRQPEVTCSDVIGDRFAATSQQMSLARRSVELPVHSLVSYVTTRNFIIEHSLYAHVVKISSIVHFTVEL